MARYVYTTVRLNEIPGDFPFCWRYRLEDEALKDSIARRGEQLPLTLDEKKNVLNGHRRVWAASALGMDSLEALVLNQSLPPKDLFLFSLLSNWNQSLLDLDRAWALRCAAKFHFSEEELLNEILPALGLQPAKHLLEEYLEISALDPSLLDLLADGKLPFRGLRALSRFNKEDQRTFAGEIAPRIHLTSGQLMDAASWLGDLMKTSGLPLSRFLAGQKINIPAEDLPADRRQKGEQFHKALRSLRFPKLAGLEEKFSRVSREIGSGKDLTLEAPAHFEEEGYRLRLNLKRPESLDQLLARLSQKRSDLNSLFDIML